MKRLLIDLPKISDWQILRTTVVVMIGVSIFLVCILPITAGILWIIFTVLLGPLF